MKNLNYLFLVLTAACATTVLKEAKKPTSSEVSQPSTPTVPSSTSGQTTVPVQGPVTSAPVKSYKVPALQLPSNASTSMHEALELFKQHAQSDDFYVYVRKTVKKLDGGNETDVERAITKTRECFDKLGNVDVRFRNYGVWPLYKSAAIGGWDGYQINQNPKKSLTSIERAGYWYHELTHACGYNHVSNNITTHPIIRQSWPYQAGYAFEDYVTEKRRTNVQLAGE